MNKNLRIVFMGTPDFAVESLKILVKSNYNIVGVITAPDKPAGRGQQINKSAVKVYAEKQAIPLLQPSNLKDEHFLSQLKKLNANLQIVVAFRMLPEAVWNMPVLGTFNLHASLLPQYRGAAPINWAIINGEKETGVTTFFLQHEIDTGNIILQEKVSISENETAGELHDKLMLLGAKLVLKTVQQIEHNSINPQPQNTNQSLKLAYKIFKPFCKIDWNKPINEIHNHIRGLSPYPTAFTFLKHKQSSKVISCKVFKSNLINEKHKLKTGTIVATKNELKIAVDEGFISILELQPEGKKRMNVTDFLNGTSINDIELQLN
ncbi:MAG: methionyl-tRNA formyltransferase [Flavobacteriales bacterium CG18_big_fil_WC_8_21_14_2_50_32_9]|nr:methionyl-tRNA formyltransferase [Flavobacteriales bacterium]PIQ15958.1 MAG: methionyl-tRNA formyltransferase [Flavobacteriales bacterium CG18_big_fil_WC_8_21_14_2_50_32_9]PJC61575.1 MAG: methionyl-tRNA formyltransferase [Flavobacteriales bacterium CG_4_9_14_0_2_um_filter_32_27]